jgi:hypothetical protein
VRGRMRSARGRAPLPCWSGSDWNNDILKTLSENLTADYTDFHGSKRNTTAD